ncbi:hypothetical protein METBIDRAFT_31769 [Metschnikowia bicuspidata var. bicuspidata NRRL YB-4993]|uniref:Nudix hydrolase domain-containing protein n=1 Tax=Metschnikowia bicuspidata var. bicuspidata NRRL YB-4993 TaxID=869754 RepID=A0A1A0HB19_9ASCO|nr:hypothetical protein METBIDRAFT_31769 [Metschnikowia bicuspidata var. bicuspidata NRRL YB-4993]OBA21185.1 hypothetical protein METBIDRAFT_31769 [Metschnikowia bicuspidata var. bicuspidata NRRL YB-4993]
MSSTLHLVDLVDTFPYETNEFYWTLTTCCEQPLGYITPDIAKRFTRNDHAHYFDVDMAIRRVKISNKLDTIEKRDAAFKEIALFWRRTDPSLEKGWRDELYTVYFPKATPYAHLERAFACLLGVVTYGVHITGYVPADKTRDNTLKIWVPKRSATKQTYPGKLDNTIAGGLAYPYSITENAIKECYEEGGLSESFVKQNLVGAGVLSYMCQPFGPKGHVQPEVEYIYDLIFDSETDNIPQPIDGEAEDFKLMLITEVHQRILNDEFKPNSALVIVDFMIRHGYLSWENEPHYLEIVSRIHRKLPFSTMN